VEIRKPHLIKNLNFIVNPLGVYYLHYIDMNENKIFFLFFMILSV